MVSGDLSLVNVQIIVSPLPLTAQSLDKGPVQSASPRCRTPRFNVHVCTEQQATEEKLRRRRVLSLPGLVRVHQTQVKGSHLQFVLWNVEPVVEGLGEFCPHLFS